MGLDGRELFGALAPDLAAKAETMDALAERFGLEADEAEAEDVCKTMRWLWDKHTGRAA
jgi:hypothetical protein